MFEYGICEINFVDFIKIIRIIFKINENNFAMFKETNEVTNIISPNINESPRSGPATKFASIKFSYIVLNL